jgi:hypothetical protein
MDIHSIRKLYKYLLADSLSLVYAGSFEDAVTTKAIKLSEHNIDKSEDLASLKKKSSYLMAECFQNVVRHNEGEKFSQYHPAQQGFFMSRSRKHMFYIASSNIVDHDLIDELRDKLKKLNDLTKDELKALYMDVLKNKSLSEKGGAGLGLIEMARKSGHPLSFDFKKMGEDHDMFYLLIQLNSTAGEKESELIELTDVEDIHRVMIENDILLIYKGDFSQQSISPIINMLETNLQSHDIEYFDNKKIFVTLVEMIQNITNHGVEMKNGVKPGILAISRKGGAFQLGAGNYMQKDNVDKVTNYVERLNKMEFEEIRKEYKAALFKTTLENYKAELGLLDIAKTSKNKLHMHISNEFGDHPFFSFMVDM